jgi:hypothetical protein
VDTVNGLRGNFVDGVFFTEDAGAIYRIQESAIQVKISRQNANLPQLKQQLAHKVRQAGGNALVGFTYGQKRSFFGWDDVAWQGAGFPAILEMPTTT